MAATLDVIRVARIFLAALGLSLGTWLLLPSHGLAQDAGSTALTPSPTTSVDWRSLDAEQRTALRPLAALWSSLGSDQQRKWIALTHNYGRMTPDERNILQGRMTEWAKLTPAQRTQARLNFGEVRKVPADERRAKWEEYQALPAEERERLAHDRPQGPRGAAPALRPAPASKLLRPARPAQVASASARALMPGAPSLNRNTLLPQSAQPASESSR